jgi:hypothetical protein
VIGYLGYRAARGQWRLYKKSRAQKGGPWTFLAVLFTVLPFTVLWMAVSAAQGQLWGSLVSGGVNAALVFLVLLDSGRVKRPAKAPALLEASPQQAAGAMRERAAQLRELERGSDDRAGRDAAERDRRVADLLSVPCPEESCLAGIRTGCVLGSGQPAPAVAVVRKRPLLLCHLERMKDSVRYGTASSDDILAQFDNTAPEGFS